MVHEKRQHRTSKRSKQRIIFIFFIFIVVVVVVNRKGKRKSGVKTNWWHFGKRHVGRARCCVGRVVVCRSHGLGRAQLSGQLDQVVDTIELSICAAVDAAAGGGSVFLLLLMVVRRRGAIAAVVGERVYGAGERVLAAAAAAAAAVDRGRVVVAANTEQTRATARRAVEASGRGEQLHLRVKESGVQRLVVGGQEVELDVGLERVHARRRVRYAHGARALEHGARETPLEQPLHLHADRLAILGPDTRVRLVQRALERERAQAHDLLVHGHDEELGDARGRIGRRRERLLAAPVHEVERVKDTLLASRSIAGSSSRSSSSLVAAAAAATIICVVIVIVGVVVVAVVVVGEADAVHVDGAVPPVGEARLGEYHVELGRVGLERVELVAGLLEQLAHVVVHAALEQLQVGDARRLLHVEVTRLAHVRDAHLHALAALVRLHRVLQVASLPDLVAAVEELAALVRLDDGAQRRPMLLHLDLHVQILHRHALEVLDELVYDGRVEVARAQIVRTVDATAAAAAAAVATLLRRVVVVVFVVVEIFVIRNN